MNRPTDVIEMLRQANPVPPGSVDDGHFPTVAELQVTWRSVPSERAPVVWDPGTPNRQRRWPMYGAAAALAAGVVALFLVPPDPEVPVEPVATFAVVTESPFVGVWVSTDSDGSFQSMEILRGDGSDFELVVSDDYATVCKGVPSTITGTGQLQAVDTLIFPQPVLTCDDGTTPEIDGAPLGDELIDRMANLTFIRDPASDELADSFDVSWQRATVDSDGSPIPPDGGPAGARAAVSQLIEAVNAVAADDSLDETSLPDVFTPDATISAFDGWGNQPVSTPGLLGTWIDHLQTWGFEASVPKCALEGEQLRCTVRARWQTVSAEADEAWTVTMFGDRIQTLSVFSPGERFDDPLLPMALAELDEWEYWLRDTDPGMADRLLTLADPEHPFPLVPRYDPVLAGEIAASIQQYIEQRPSGEQITVTPDLVNFGDRLVGSLDAMVRTDARTYVLAGRFNTEADWSVPPETAVLAAFDDAGAELWRTELAGTPRHLETVADDLWVIGRAETLTRIDSSNGEVLDVVTVGSASAMTAAFGSVWVQTLGPTEGAAQLVRVDPDLSMTTVELPDVDTGDLVPSGPAVGAGAVWVPLGAGGVARVDPDTLELTVITAEEIGHNVLYLAFDGDVGYVASSWLTGGSTVSSIVEGQVRSTSRVGEVWYLGPVGDDFGVLGASGFFTELTADDPMLGEVRQLSLAAQSGPVGEIDGEAWVEAGENYDLRRVEFVPLP